LINEVFPPPCSSEHSQGSGFLEGGPADSLGRGASLLARIRGELVEHHADASGAADGEEIRRFAVRPSSIRLQTRSWKWPQSGIGQFVGSTPLQLALDEQGPWLAASAWIRSRQAGSRKSARNLTATVLGRANIRKAQNVASRFSWSGWLPAQKQND